MINFEIGASRHALAEIGVLVHLASRNEDWAAEHPGAHNNPALRANPEYMRAVEETKAFVRSTVALVRTSLSYLKCPHIDACAASLERWATQDHGSWGELRMKAVGVRTAITTELEQYFYYQYPRPKADILRAWQGDWTRAIGAFPSVEMDSSLATDCYALGHNVASVFHCMRVLEYGLKAVAADVGVTFDLQQWHNVIDQIESKIAAERKALPKGAPRNDRLKFLSEVAKEFFYFKDGWRNHVSHNRADYDEHQALSVLVHVRAFMNHLASQLSEVP